MITLTFGDFIALFLLNLLAAGAVAYVKRRAELSAEEGSEVRKHLKEIIRGAVAEARDVLTELRVQEFRVHTGRRRLSRMNSLVEKLSLADPELGTLVWKLVNAPTLLSVMEENRKKAGVDPKVTKYEVEMKNNYFKDIEGALQRCAELEKNPIVKK